MRYFRDKKISKLLQIQSNHSLAQLFDPAYQKVDSFILLKNFMMHSVLFDNFISNKQRTQLRDLVITLIDKNKQEQETKQNTIVSTIDIRHKNTCLLNPSSSLLFKLNRKIKHRKEKNTVIKESKKAAEAANSVIVYWENFLKKYANIAITVTPCKTSMYNESRKKLKL